MSGKMKSVFKRLQILVMVIALAVLAGNCVQAQAGTVKVSGKYYQSDARKMLKAINKFRTGKQAWYYTAEGSDEKTYVKGLKKLQYDYGLEKAAMKRAVEISKSFSHTRPNGSSCFTAYPAGYMAMGENIAMGTNYIMTTSHTLEMWKETNKSYYGQGHRRNMLNRNFTCVGIACFEVNGCKYWVQEFGSPTKNTNKTKACDTNKTVKIKVK
ncbi:MAG: CAP domain-containing protein [Lachnospiraceae bacterium]|nr:CAP domain-containing protein [Lachnospiraceae bacterium]